MSGGSAIGCVAGTPDNPIVFFREGQDCAAGSVAGTLTCSCIAGPPLDATSCPTNKPSPSYPDTAGACP
jgi:hypothetical protein